MESELKEGSKPVSVIHHVSKSVIRPSSPPLGRRRSIHLTPWDLRFLSIQYSQSGILLPNPRTPPTTVIHHLIASLSIALNDFYPLAGRFSTTHQTVSPPSLSVAIDCNDEGAEFTHSTADQLTSSDVLSPQLMPHILHSLFPLNQALCLHGHSLPLLAIQATVLTDDAIFLACSFNHAVADGTSFWHFLNSWSAISRSDGINNISPIFDRWFLPVSPIPILLPFLDLESQITAYTPPELAVSMFHFTARTIDHLKLKANSGGCGRISSLQSLLAHVWICVVRASQLPADQETGCRLAVGCRQRLDPPLPAGYFGNSIMTTVARTTAGELLSCGISWAASRLKEAVSDQTDGVVRKHVKSWIEKPKLASFNELRSGDLVVGGSARFDVYRNDFGWGRPVGVRSGRENIFDGKVRAFPGPEEGSMALEISLLPSVMSKLAEDDVFMNICELPQGME